MFGCAPVRRLLGFARDHIEQLKQDGGQCTPGVLGSCQQLKIFESIEIDLGHQPCGRAFTEPPQQFCKIRVLVPANARQRYPVGGVQPNQVAATAMVWA